jgi:hypothetical protein
MTSLPLDPKKLLGFKLIPMTPSKPGAAIAIKQGGKGVTVQLGAKVGEKAGIKAIDLAQRC